MPPRSMLIAACAVLTAFVTPAPGRAAETARVRALVLEQLVSGIPGMEPGETLPQRLTIDAAGRRLLLASATRDSGVGLAGTAVSRVLLRLDEKPPRIYEINDRDRSYTVRGADLHRLQQERDTLEQALLVGLKKRPPDEQRKILEENFLRLDGKRDVVVERGARRDLLGYDCQEVTVTENGRVVIRVWVTEEIEGGRSFYDLYQSLGAFSREVLDRVKSITGLPLAAQIKVVTAAPTYDIEARCEKVETDVEVPASVFDVPSDYRRIEEKPGIVPCPVCGRDVEWDEPRGGIHVDPFTGEETRTCSPECKETMNRRLREKAARALGDRKKK